MKDNKTVTIDGRTYDKEGNPVNKNQLASDKKPINKIITRQDIHRPIGRSMDIARSKNISHFAGTVNNIKKKKTPKPIKKPTNGHQTMDVAMSKNRFTKRTSRLLNTNNDIKKAKKTAPLKSAKMIKEEAIAEAMRKAPIHEDSTVKPKKITKKVKKIIIICLIIVAVLLGGGLTYYLFPTPSIYIAGLRSGVDATYPDYIPDGYRLNGPARVQDSKIVIDFVTINGNDKFSITETQSSWDSSALKNKVNEDSNGEFLTTSIDGLTIFTYKNNTSWINGGLLFTITWDAPLSSTQVQKIATGL